MAPGYVFQVSLRVTVQNQIRISQRVVVNKIVQLRSLRHGHVQRILDPGTVDRDFSPILEQRAELDWLLYNKSLEYAQMVLSGEIEHYLSLGRGHGRLEDQ